MNKKLENVAKSPYSHEIRKDVDLTSLKSLILEESWPYMRQDVAHEIGCCHFVCTPYLTEAHLYKVTSIFVQTDNTTDGKTFKPLGELVKYINRARTNRDYVDLLECPFMFEDTKFKFPHEGVKITLQDLNHSIKVRVILLQMSRTCIPRDKNFVENVYLDLNNPDLKGKKSVYMITNVVRATTTEFRANIDTSCRIFHMGHPTPIVFALEEFFIDDEGKLIAKEPVTVDSKHLHWTKMYPGDELFVPPEVQLPPRSA